MLTNLEYETVVQSLAYALSVQGNPRTALVAMVAEAEFRTEFPTWPQNANQLAREAINQCIASGWIHVPPWLQQILSKITQTPEIAQILTKIANKPADWQAPTAGEPFDDWWLPDSKLPFINRVNLREYLRRLDAPTGPSVLIVNGPTKSGKTYSVELLAHTIRRSLPLERRDLPLPIALITLTPGMGTLLSPQRLAELIVERITNNPKPLPDLTSVTPDRHNEALCDWIIDNISEAGEKWWIVLDNLDNVDQPELTPITRSFISKLIEMVSIGKYRKKLRLLITNYAPTLVLGVPLSEMNYEQLNLIGEVDLESFFKKVLDKAGQPPPSPLAIQLAVQFSMLGLPQDSTRLMVLNERIRKVVANV
jgi:hypothetical protein